MSAPARKAVLTGGLLVAIALAWAAWPRGAETVPPTRSASRAAVEPEPPLRAREDYPALETGRAGESIERAEALARSRERPTVLARPEPAPREIAIGDRAPAAPASTVTAWSADYRAAVCGCKTRSCVNDVQPRFMRQLSAVAYDAERDEAAYTAAAREAIRCFAALPEDS